MSFRHTLPRQLRSNKGHTGIFNHISKKTEQRIKDALQKVYAQHEIVPDSSVGILLKNGIHKLIIGMHHLHDAVNELNNELPDDSKLNSRASIKRLFYEDFLKACEKKDSNTERAIERVLTIEMGRTKVVSNILYKMKELNGKDLRDGYKVLGSLVRQTIDIYRELGGAEFNFCKNPPVHRRQIEIQRGKEAGKMLGVQRQAPQLARAA